MTVIFASTEKMAALVKPLESLKGRVRLVVYWGTGNVHAVKARAKTLSLWAGDALDAQIIKPAAHIMPAGACACWAGPGRTQSVQELLREGSGPPWSTHRSRPC